MGSGKKHHAEAISRDIHFQVTVDTHDDDLGADRRDEHDCSISFEEFLSMVEVLPNFFLGHLLQIKAPEKRRMILNIPKIRH